MDIEQWHRADPLNCPAVAALGEISGKWKPAILYFLFSQTRRFSELQRLIPTISHKTLTQQLRELEEAGIIRGYRALLDEKRLGYDIMVFAMVHLVSQAEADLAAFEEHVRNWPLVRECWMLSGEVDFILKCVAPDLNTFQAFVAELTAAPNVRNVKTALTLRRSKDEASVPLEDK